MVSERQADAPCREFGYRFYLVGYEREREGGEGERQRVREMREKRERRAEEREAAATSSEEGKEERECRLEVAEDPR